MTAKLNILGTEYTILSQTEDENPKLDGADGIAELYAKEIVIDLSEPTDKNTIKNIEAYNNDVLRHEIIHAMFHESGLEKYCRDETLVQWIAMQYTKMEKLLNDENITAIIDKLKE